MKCNECPELFSLLRSLIDIKRSPGRFLLLDSASPLLIKGVSESLAGRIKYEELGPVNLPEIPSSFSIEAHWFKGGFPDALTAKSNQEFVDWMDSFIVTFIERDLPDLFDFSFSRITMRNFWVMLAHSNSGIWNAQAFSRSLGIAGPTVNKYLDYLEGAFIIHRLPAYFNNVKKRLIKSPKIYLRDTGLLHRLLRIENPDELHGHSIIGASWEGYVVEQINQTKNKNIDLYYYRTQDGAESDLVLVKANKPIACIEIKYAASPNISKGFFITTEDLKTKENYIIIPSGKSYKIKKNVRVSGLKEFIKKILPGIH